MELSKLIPHGFIQIGVLIDTAPANPRRGMLGNIKDVTANVKHGNIDDVVSNAKGKLEYFSG